MSSLSIPATTSSCFAVPRGTVKYRTESMSMSTKPKFQEGENTGTAGEKERRGGILGKMSVHLGREEGT